MTVVFKTEYLAYLYEKPLDTIKGKHHFGKDIIKQFKRKIEILMSIKNITQLKEFKSLSFEFLKGNRKGECSIRLNQQYRLIFEIKNKDELEIIMVHEISKHYE